ncbi:hypothetical protein BLNAU_5642 [Blattamonas nauphoetae]|uniref:tRNA-intron lyase n=1 Tax=Blattamonas nauphoetae TaxID=2049346 RepID=A0ABQ9Y6K6_9EUKA|nr:hypothetical protein BLNAU_5642 [Blattamonas nauphoetae]
MSLLLKDNLFLAFDNELVLSLESKRILGRQFGIPSEHSVTYQKNIPYVYPTPAAVIALALGFVTVEDGISLQPLSLDSLSFLFQTEQAISDLLIFTDLYFKGLFIATGLKYGSDYVAYEDHPNNCHSRFAVVIQHPSRIPHHQHDYSALPSVNPSQTTHFISPRTLVSQSRLCTTVRKDLLLCSASFSFPPDTFSLTTHCSEMTLPLEQRTLLYSLDYVQINWAGHNSIRSKEKVADENLPIVYDE